MDFLYAESRKIYSLFQRARSYVRRLVTQPSNDHGSASVMVDRLVAEPWYVDSVTSDGGTPEVLTVTGWALSAPSIDSGDREISC
jgi:hypothetical protein